MSGAIRVARDKKTRLNERNEWAEDFNTLLKLYELILDGDYDITLQQLAQRLKLTEPTLRNRMGENVKRITVPARFVRQLTLKERKNISWTTQRLSKAQEIWGETWTVETEMVFLSGRPCFLHKAELKKYLSERIYYEGTRGPILIDSEHLDQFISGNVQWESQKPPLSRRTQYRRCFFVEKGWKKPIIRYEWIQG